jgi:hypothetical protein
MQLAQELLLQQVPCGHSGSCATNQHCSCCCLLLVLQVSLAALALLQVCINICPGVLESNLEKLMPLLFLKLCAGKQSVRSAAEAALQGRCQCRLSAALCHRLHASSS